MWNTQRLLWPAKWNFCDTPHVLLWTRKFLNTQRTQKELVVLTWKLMDLWFWCFSNTQNRHFWEKSKNHTTLGSILNILNWGVGGGEHYHKPWETERRGELLNFSRSMERNRHKAERGRRDTYHCEWDARWFPVLTQFLNTLNCSCGQTRIMPETLSALLSQSGRQTERQVFSTLVLVFSFFLHFHSRFLQGAR